MRKYILPSILLLIFSISVSGQPGRVPKFNQYPAVVEKARVKSINFQRNPSALTFRTRLSEAIAGGVNFAGHYIVTGWGCGTGCTNAAIIEARTGDVIWPDQFMNIDASYGDGYSDEQIEYKKNSRLLIIHGRPGSKNENAKIPPSGDHYYEWRGNRLHLLKSVPKKSN
jgi:hypothetical protein